MCCSVLQSLEDRGIKGCWPLKITNCASLCMIRIHSRHKNVSCHIEVTVRNNILKLKLQLPLVDSTELQSLTLPLIQDETCSKRLPKKPTPAPERWTNSILIALTRSGTINSGSSCKIGYIVQHGWYTSYCLLFIRSLPQFKTSPNILSPYVIL